MKAQWEECENVLRGFLDLINLKMYSCCSIMVKLDKWLSTKRYCTFVQSWNILWLATTNYFLVTTGRETQCAWMDLLWTKLFYSMVPRALWVFILVSLVLASRRHWNKRLVIVNSKEVWNSSYCYSSGFSRWKRGEDWHEIKATEEVLSHIGPTLAHFLFT